MFTLYLVGAKNIRNDKKPRFCKIGHTKNLKKRLCALNCSSPLKLYLIDSINSDNKELILGLENRFKKKWHGYNVKREWFYYEKEVGLYFNEIKEGLLNG